jgi:hypothetical protein
MHSSPNYLVVNRSEGAEVLTNGEEPSEEGHFPFVTLRSHRDEIDVNELHITLKISYKTVLLVFVAFNVGGRIINAFF